MKIWVTWRFTLWDIQNYFKYIIRNHEAVTDNLTIRIYTNQIENKITYKTKAGYYLELLTSEMMEFIGGAKSKTTKIKNGKNVPRLKFTKVVLFIVIFSTIIMNKN